MARRIFLTVISLCLIAAFLPLSTFSSDGKIPIYEAQTISSPGHYYLTRDLSLPFGEEFYISSDDVTFDLGGHVITDGGTAVSYIRILNAPSNVIIRNGKLTGSTNPIVASGADGLGLTLENLEIRDSGFESIALYGAATIKIHNCKISNSGTTAIYIEGSDWIGEISNNIIDGGVDGIYAYSLSNGTVRDNHIINMDTSTGEGINLEGGEGNVVENNRIRNAKRGIVSTDSDYIVIKNNTVSGITGYGIEATSLLATLSGNTVHSDDHGILVTRSMSRVTGNSVQSGGHGIYIDGGSYSLIEDNVSEGNTGYGLYFSNTGSHAYRNNMLRNNTGGAVFQNGNTDAGGNIL